MAYARVLTSDQNISTQIELLKENNCEKVYTDIAIGVRDDWEGLIKILSYLRRNDIIIGYKTDRIFRSLKNMVDLIKKFNKKRVLFKSITEHPFNTTSANGKFIIQIFGSVDEFERNLINKKN